MSFENVKAWARLFGMYRLARWVYRHTINRDEVRALRDELAFFRPFIRPGDLCFDVGANYGFKTEVFLRLGARVIAFEPQSNCIEELKSRLGKHPRLVPVNAAVGSSPGFTTLHVGRDSTASSLIKDWQGEAVESVEVTVTTLDDAIAKFGVPHYCKIDVEGYELEVLKGLSRAVPILSYEYHRRKDGIAQAIACLDYLSTLGDVLVNVTPAERPEFARAQWWTKSDFVDFFCRTVPEMEGYDYGDIFVKIQADRHTGA